MSLERVRNWYWSLNRFDSVVAMLIVSISCLLLFRLPLITHYRGIYFNETFQYLLIVAVCSVLLFIVRPPTLNSFGWPKISWVGFVLVLISVAYVWLDMSDGFVIKEPMRFKVAGVISLLAIGLAEELLSRVLVFGTLQRFGNIFAVLVSSILFGLMHINVYLPDWDSWLAFWHVMNTMGFAFFVCALFIATRSYWVIAIFHALSDWTVVFDKYYSGGNDSGAVEIFDGLKYGIEEIFLPLGVVGLFFLYVLRGRWPRWVLGIMSKIGLVKVRLFVQRVALRFKLIEE